MTEHKPCPKTRSMLSKARHHFNASNADGATPKTLPAPLPNLSKYTKTKRQGGCVRQGPWDPLVPERATKRSRTLISRHGLQTVDCPFFLWALTLALALAPNSQRIIRPGVRLRDVVKSLCERGIKIFGDLFAPRLLTDIVITAEWIGGASLKHDPWLCAKKVHGENTFLFL